MSGFVFDDDLEPGPIPGPESVSESPADNGSPPPREGRQTGTDSPIPAVRESGRESESVSAPSGLPSELIFQPAAPFADEDEPTAETLLGTDDDEAALTAGGVVVMYGKGGAGKTILALDVACHLATGTRWLGLDVPRPLRVAFIEHDGARGRFRRTVRTKLAGWTGPDVGDRLAFLAHPWGTLRLSDAVDRERLAAYLNEAGVDVLIAGPIVSLGMIGGGTPDEVALFEAHLAALRELLERPLLVVLLHHTNQRGQISGAWDRVPDTLLLVVNTGKATRLRWEKARNSSALHATSWKLKWSDGLTFELDETPDTTEDEIEEGLLASALANPGEGWRTIAKSVRGNAETKKDVRDRLFRERRLVNLGTGSAMRIHHADDVEPDVLEQITFDDEDASA